MRRGGSSPTGRRVTRLADLKKARPPADYPVDVPQGGTWALWLVLVILTILIIRAGIFLAVG
jgi:hypothetical protein